MPTVRANATVALSHPAHGALIVVTEGDDHQSDDPLVAAYPWAFVQDNIEQATAAPGQRRRRKPADD